MQRVDMAALATLWRVDDEALHALHETSGGEPMQDERRDDGSSSAEESCSGRHAASRTHG